MNLMQNTLLQGGKYRIEKVLGQGGFGITYMAVQTGLNRKVAIKEFFMKEYCNRDGETSQVSIGSEGSKELVARFRLKFIKEAQTIAGLNHPHIIRIHDIFEENGTAYYVMEYHDHGSLSELIKQRGSLPEAEALRYIREMADALGYIHEHQMNHLDVKPGNVLLDEKGRSVLIDFGLSKRYDESGQQTSTTPVGISHGYAPMEQYKHGGVETFSPATDIYSLGATFYKLLTGQTPPDASDVFTDGLPALPASVSSSVANAIAQAMTPNKKGRPQTVEAFLSLLDKEPVVVDDDDESTKFEPIKPESKSKSSSKPKQKLRFNLKNEKLGTNIQTWLLNVAYYLLYVLMLCWNGLLLLGSMVSIEENELSSITFVLYLGIIVWLLRYIRRPMKRAVHWIGIGSVMGTILDMALLNRALAHLLLISLLLYGLFYWVIVLREKSRKVN